MTIVQASLLTNHELSMLGTNLMATVRRQRRSNLDAVNRSLGIHQEQVGRLYRRRPRRQRKLIKAA